MHSSRRACGLLLGPSLLSTRGEVHRRQRKILNPIFSTANMRKLAPVFAKVSATVCRLLPFDWLDT